MGDSEAVVTVWSPCSSARWIGWAVYGAYHATSAATISSANDETVTEGPRKPRSGTRSGQLGGEAERVRAWGSGPPTDVGAATGAAAPRELSIRMLVDSRDAVPKMARANGVTRASVVAALSFREPRSEIDDRSFGVQYQ